MGLQIGKHGFGHDLEHVGIGQARLGFGPVVFDIRQAFAVAQGKVIRMLFSILARRNLAAKGMADERLAGRAPVLRFAPYRVDAQPGSQHGRTVRFAVVAPTEGEWWRIGSFQRTDYHFLRQLGNVCVVGRQESHTDVVFQKCIDSVERTAGRPTRDGDEVVSDDDAQFLRAHRCDLESRAAVGQRLTGADQDMPVGSIGSGDNRQFDAARLREDPAETLRLHTPRRPTRRSR